MVSRGAVPGARLHCGTCCRRPRLAARLLAVAFLSLGRVLLIVSSGRLVDGQAVTGAPRHDIGQSTIESLGGYCRRMLANWSSAHPAGARAANREHRVVARGPSLSQSVRRLMFTAVA